MKIYSAIYNDFAHLEIFGKPDVVYLPDELETTDSILILHGGADISPSLYGQERGKYTQADTNPSKRDKLEIALAERAIAMGIPIFGICRGAQLLTALAGGTLIQDVTGHTGGKHFITTKDGDSMIATSAHHQMCNPVNTDHELLAWSSKKQSTRYWDGNNQDVPMAVEPEVIFYPKLRALAIQAHPEWMDYRSDFVKYCINLTKTKLIGDNYASQCC
jgi:gamma-glutamyl-gamma-aminobutyrate hydrolase PuuD